MYYFYDCCAFLCVCLGWATSYKLDQIRLLGGNKQEKQHNDVDKGHLNNTKTRVTAVNGATPWPQPCLHSCFTMAVNVKTKRHWSLERSAHKRGSGENCELLQAATGWQSQGSTIRGPVTWSPREWGNQAKSYLPMAWREVPSLSKRVHRSLCCFKSISWTATHLLAKWIILRFEEAASMWLHTVTVHRLLKGKLLQMLNPMGLLDITVGIRGMRDPQTQLESDWIGGSHFKIK